MNVSIMNVVYGRRRSVNEWYLDKWLSRLHSFPDLLVHSKNQCFKSPKLMVIMRYRQSRAILPTCL